MDALLAALAASDPATALRFSRWGYAAVNTGHVLGIALLVGAIAPLDLRLLGAWRSVPLDAVARVAIPVAAAGLALAITSGALLFATRAPEYAAMPVVWAKLALVATGATAALATHLRAGRALHHLSRRARLRQGALSLTCWLGALVAGRMIAFLAG
ncbi:MAG: DUF2214 domain-containing protein [Azospirillaceae bacterium]